MADTSTPTPPASSEPLPLPRLIRVPGGEPDMNATLTEAAAQAVELAASLKEPIGNFPIKLRLTPTIYLYGTQNYAGWRGMTWVLEVGEEDAVAFATHLDAWVRDWVLTRAGQVQD